MQKEVKDFLIDRHESIKQAMERLSKVGSKQLFVVDEKTMILGALSDGDIRKWVLTGGSLRQKVIKICNKKPITVNKNYSIEFVRQTMLKFEIQAIAVVNAKNLVSDVLTWEQVFAGKVHARKEHLDASVVIMAGGKGTRLDPFTRILPKALIPIDGKPVIEVIMDKFNEYGTKDFYITLNHKARMIKSYFEEMNQKYQITYIQEDKPLGTAGSLKALEKKLKGPFLVTNCDVIIDSDYTDMVHFHKTNKHDLTVVVSCRHYVIPYGVCEIQGRGLLKSIKEKPEYDLLVNTGMYVINTSILGLVPKGKLFNMTDLILAAKRKNLKVGVYPVDEKSWTDIGQWEEYYKAVKDLGVNFKDHEQL